MLIGIQSKLDVGAVFGAQEVAAPTSHQQFQAITGLSLSAFYPCTSASGSLVDTVAAANLTAVGSPKYLVGVGGDLGVSCELASSGFSASVNDPGLSSCIIGAIGTHPGAVASLPGIVGRASATGFPSIAVYRALSTVNYPTALIRDSGANSLSLSDVTADVVTPPRPCLYLVQIDRAATTARFFVYDSNKQLVNQTGSIAGWATFSGGTTPGFYIGSFAISLTAGFASSLAFYATGAQCEGTTILSSIARGLGFGG